MFLFIVVVVIVVVVVIIVVMFYLPFFIQVVYRRQTMTLGICDPFRENLPIRAETTIEI